MMAVIIPWWTTMKNQMNLSRYRMRKCSFAVLLCILLFLTGRQAEAGFLDGLLKILGLSSDETSLSEDRIIAGFREALKIGTENTVELTGKIDGYFANQAIKILLPENIMKFEDAMRFLGYGPKIDEFVLSMNRAAEKAAPHARNIFLDAIKQITFEDARRLLTGGDTSITEFFRDKTYDNLFTAFAPVIEKELEKYDVTAKYMAVVNRYRKLPLAEKISVLDMNRYVTTKALDGLFYVLSEEERNIRNNPSARVTELLREVFK
jgi:hypothetical protein